jgi:transcriptional regulator with PAS, ATPase and Fis domain
MGETGTGKTALAKLIHERSRRRGNRFECFDVASCPSTLLSSQLFGCERGAYTDAREARPGIVERARGGTLCLDEIDALAVAEQRALLALCDSGSLRRLGSAAEIRCDVRIIAATNAHLSQLIQQGRFRSDLFFRLDVLSHTLPALRERASDFPAVCQASLEQVWERMKDAVEGPLPALTTDAIEALWRCNWPGNVRELQAVLQRAIAAEPSRPWLDSTVVARWCGLGGTEGAAGHGRRDAISIQVSGTAPACGPERRPPYRSVDDAAAERRRIVAALRVTGGHLTLAARSVLGMSRQTLWRKIKRHSLSPSDWLGDR